MTWASDRGIARPAGKHLHIVQASDHGLDAACEKRGDFRIVPQQAAHSVAPRNEACGNAASGVAGGAGHKEFHYDLLEGDGRKLGVPALNTLVHRISVLAQQFVSRFAALTATMN